ncbi:putative transcription factor MYB/SANT family [Medicago truncatula]|uniref:MYB-like DNA-binding domain, shaqkyf class protein n=1 Tax=Medicago truncatula TaxID=3880 RepID=G7L8M9_MEDTR|nr:MYB-like DNA-binding domain, shaqkyf class protein [Medicago truncatula]RHN41819.1 putative transcription factor MYB/SANT family [Medicago truncatula]
MPMETIDLTYFLDSPPSIPISSSVAPMILNFDSTNPNLHHQHNTTFLGPSAQEHTHQSHQMITTNCPQTGTHGGSLIARVLRPLPGSNTMPFPSGSRQMVPWSQTEHDLFVMGLIKYGQGRWGKIAENFVCNKTPQQVQSYAASFFRHLPDEYVHGLKKRKYDFNGINSSSSASYYSMHNMIANNDPAKETLALFPIVPTYHEGEASRRNNTNNYEASTSMTLPSPSAGDGGVDLELRLGLY